MNSRAGAGVGRLLLIVLATAVVVTRTAACGAPAASPDAAGTAASPPTVRLTAATPVQGPTSAPTGTRTAPTSPALPPTSSPSPGRPSTTAAATADPDAAVAQLAVDWLIAYRTADSAGPADAWIDRTAPYVTDQLARQNEQLRRDGRGPGVAWQDFTDRRCTARVVDAAAVIPPEAPRTGGTVHVQVAGTLRTSCATGADPPDEVLAVTLTAVRIDIGWRIASRDY